MTDLLITPSEEQVNNLELNDTRLSDSLEVLSKEKAINPASVSMAITITNSLALMDSFVSYLAIMRGSTGVIQGLIVSVKQLGTALLNPVWGYLSDNYGRRKFMTIGLIINAIIAMFLPFAATPELILILVGIQAIFGAMITPSWVSWIGDRSNKSNRASTFGKLSMIGSWSSMIGNLGISFYMDYTDPNLEHVETLRFPLLLSASLAFLSSILVLFLSKERPFKDTKKIHVLSPVERVKEALHSVNLKFRKFILVEGIFYFTWAAAWPLFPYVQFNVANSWLDFAVMQLFFAIPSGLSYFYGGKIADRIGFKKMIRLTRPILVFPPITASLAAFYGNIYFIYLGNMLVGFTLGAAMVSVNSLLIEYAPEDKRATYISMHTMTIGILAFLSSTMMGMLLQIFSGNDIPSDKLLITLLLSVSAARFIASLLYKFIPCPEDVKDLK